MPRPSNWVSIFRSLLTVFLVTTVMPIYAYMFGNSPEPSLVQIKLTKTGVVADFKFVVRKHFYYSYMMRFGFTENDQVERERVRKLLGGHALDKSGKPLEPSTPTSINLTIFAICKDGKEVEIYSQDTDPVLTSWGQSRFTKNIGAHVLTPGIYRVRLVSGRGSPEFSSIPVTFEIGMPAKVNFDPTKEPIRGKLCEH